METQMEKSLGIGPGDQAVPAYRRKRQGKAPMYHRVTRSLRNRVRDGKWAPGVRLPTLHELADEFKVSVSTIRNALRILEKEGCVYQVPCVGAFVHPARPGQTSVRVTAAVAMIDIGGAFEMNIVRGVVHAFQESGWALQIYDARHDPRIEASNLTQLTSSGSQGAIVMPIGNNANLEHLVKLKLSGFPVVLVDRGIIGLNVDVVESDNEKGAFVATEHLIQHGHRRLFMVTDPVSSVPETSILTRIRGFEKALAANGIEPARNDMIWIDPKTSIQGVREGRRWLGGYEAALPLLKTASMPIGIFALNDSITWGIVQACRELKLRIPEDVSIVSFDDSDIVRAMDPPITVVAQKPGEIGRKAAELLQRRLKPGGLELQPQHVYVEVELIQRGSVADLRQP
jgi:DNA-binding LacI/PurR family transcriptional regulator